MLRHDTFATPVTAKPAALKAVTDAIDHPENVAYQTVWQVQLQKILAAETNGIFGTQIIQNVVGDYNQSIGQNYVTTIGNVQGNVKF